MQWYRYKMKFEITNLIEYMQSMPQILSPTEYTKIFKAREVERLIETTRSSYSIWTCF